MLDVDDLPIAGMADPNPIHIAIPSRQGRHLADLLADTKVYPKVHDGPPKFTIATCHHGRPRQGQSEYLE
jgi:hypothetical protein